jgi:tetrahydromethanopterin S-methyltransferase subunit G
MLLVASVVGVLYGLVFGVWTCYAVAAAWRTVCNPNHVGSE